MKYFCGLCGKSKNNEQKKDKKKGKKKKDETDKKTPEKNKSNNLAISIKQQMLNSTFRIQGKGMQASEAQPFGSRMPLFLSDVQEFLLLSIIDPNIYDYFSLDWISMSNRSLLPTFILVVNGMTMCDYKNNRILLRNLTNGFGDSCLEVLNATNSNLNAIVESMTVLLLMHQKQDELIKKFGSLDVCLSHFNDPNISLSSCFPINFQKVQPKIDTNYNRLTLILSASKMWFERYPIPIPGKRTQNCENYIFTKDKYLPVNKSSPMFSLDCERCNTEGGSEVFRISIVGEEDNIVYNTYVHPQYKILGRRMMFSEISRHSLLEERTTLSDVQSMLQKILPSDAILVGQSLNYDLHALKMMHPYVINTSCIYNMSGSRRYKSKLKHLVLEYLNRQIQNRSTGHCSVEDAEATIDLVKLKLENSPDFGDSILQRQKEYHQQNRGQLSTHQSVPVVIGNKYTTNKYIEAAYKIYNEKDNLINSIKLVTCSGNSEVLNNISKVIKNQKLIISHMEVSAITKEEMRELDESIQKIWNMSPKETMLTILLSGDQKCNGAVFFNVKNL